MQLWATLCLLLTATSTMADNVALFWNLYDAVISGGRILHDVADGVGAVSKAIRAIDHFLDSTAEAQAPADTPSTETPSLPTPTTEATDSPAPSFSGCGALGLHIRDESLPMNRLTDCCSTHDACYGTSCTANKWDCDGKLRTCLFSVCNDRTLARAEQQKCRGAAKLLFSGTMALSFQQYNTAQEKLTCKKPQKGGKRR
ncbi:Group XIIA secretory phospholipase A2-like [Homarus americanus]|uniref:Group XIIA secretory phospholipase A2-like n=1 Tax=Homarus americanus TaxID=6706 RepID=A0A8J5MW30_HOMAM|nr:Group XIIA secretory phospholipase A2-like [Homarus americanus]